MGGLAGLNLTTEVDSADLTEEEASRLDELVESAPWGGLPSRTMAKPAAFDLMEYVVTVKAGKRRRTFAGNDLSMTDEARALVAFVVARGHHLEGGRRR